MQNYSKKRFLRSVALPVVAGACLALLSLNALGQDDNAGVDLARLSSLQTRQAALEAEAQALLKKLVDKRAAILEGMRGDTLEQMAKWEEDPEYLNGQGLAAAIQNAEIIAKEYGFDVEKLHKMYVTSKKMILGLEMTGRCGEGSPQLASMEGAIDSVSQTAKGALDFFGLASHEEERLACVQTQKLKLYREVNRAYIYALTAKSARQSSQGFHDYAKVILTMSGSDAQFLADQAKKMADTQDTVFLLFEMTPVIGEMLDLYKLGTGTNALGVKASDFDKAITAVFLFTPEIVALTFKRYPQMFSSMKGFLTELAYPAGGFFDTLLYNAKIDIATFKKEAGQILDWFTDIEKDVAKKASVTIQKVARESTDAIWRRMVKMPGYGMSTEAAIRASNMVASHAASIRKVAVERGEVLMFRSFGAQGKEAMEKAMQEAIENGGKLVTKSIDIKPKSASNALLGAGIPINPALSKYEDALRLARESGDPAKITKVLDDIAEKKKQVTKLFATVDEKGRKIVDKIPATYKHNGVDQKVLWVPDANGNPLMGIRNADGKLFDPIKKKVFDVDASAAKEVMVFADPRGTKILPDYDMFAIGSKARPNDRVIGKGGEILDEVAVNTTKKGGLSQLNDESINAINGRIAQDSHVRGNLVHHGPANFWKDVPDYPITTFMPDGTVKIIVEGPAGNPDKWAKEFFHGMRQQGYKGFEPHPAWHWPPYNPRHGYHTMDEVAAMAKARGL